jgi:hypothetical protein
MTGKTVPVIFRMRHQLTGRLIERPTGLAYKWDERQCLTNWILWMKNITN